MVALHKILDILLPKVNPLPNPFVNSSDNHIEYKEEFASNYQKINWGNEIKSVKFTKDEKSKSWELADKGEVKLKPVDLDKYDMDIIKSTSVKANAFKLVKPYVLADYKYKDIAKTLGYSLSWVQRIAPRVKEAAKIRSTATPSPAE